MGWRLLALLTAVGPLLYGGGVWVAAREDGRSLAAVMCFDPATIAQASPLRVLIAAQIALGAVLLLWIVPWLLAALALQRSPRCRATAHAWSLAANSVALVLICMVLRAGPGISRGSFLGVWLVWNVLLLLLAKKPAERTVDFRLLAQRFAPALAIGAVAVLTGIVLFHREHFLQCFNGDGTEFDELARSLRLHFLPYWEIEPADCFGTFVANPTVINSYWTLALQMLLGGGELATRLPFWIWWLGIFAVAFSMIRGPSVRRGWLPAVPLALLLLLASLWYTFYVGYDAYMADVANPGVPDAMFTLLLLLGLDCLRRQDAVGWVALTTCAALLFYAGFVMFALTAAAGLVWGPLPRRRMLVAALGGGLLLTAIVAAYVAWGRWNGWLWTTLTPQPLILGAWRQSFQIEWIGKCLADLPRGRSALLFGGYFLLGCGGIAALGLPLALVRKGGAEQAWDRTVATVVLLYLLLVFASAMKNLHYLGPLLPLVVVLWLRGGLPRKGWGPSLWAAVSLAICLYLCWPLARPVFTLNRQLGALTRFATDSQEEACYMGRVTDGLYDRGQLSWQIGQHTWVGYAERSAKATEDRPLLITKGGPPSPDYRLVFQSAAGVRLYSRSAEVTRWLAVQRPSLSQQRCPWVFRPIIIRPPQR